METPKEITENGWLFYTKCRCGGVLKHKFRHTDKPGMELQWWISYKKFLIKNYNKIKVPLTPIANLNQILTTL